VIGTPKVEADAPPFGFERSASPCIESPDSYLCTKSLLRGFIFRMHRGKENKKVNERRLAIVLLIYACVFVFDDTPFTSFWDNLPQAEVEQLICAEEQEESVGMVTLIKTRLRAASHNRSALPPETYQFTITSLTRTISSLEIQSLAAGSLQRNRSKDYCIFQI
jgi:hypothetical protein